MRFINNGRTCFGTIRNNTALKQRVRGIHSLISFGTIRNNTALKHQRYT